MATNQVKIKIRTAAGYDLVNPETTMAAVSGLTSALATISTDISNKQDLLVSGSTIKTVNGNSLLGAGDIVTPLGVYYIEGNTTGSDGVWTGTHSDITAYYNGLTVVYRIGRAGAGTTTLNINNLGAGIIYRYYLDGSNTSKLTTHYRAGTVVVLTYRDGYWLTTEDYYSSEDYNMRWENSLQFGRVVSTTNDPTNIYNYGSKGYHLCMQGADGKIYAVTTGGDGAATNNVVTDAELRLGGLMIYYGTSADAATDAVLGSSYWYEGEYSGEMEYWSNKASGWAVAYRPFYIVATINANGNLILEGAGTVSSAFLTQTLPTTDDGKLYIQVGYMNNTYDAWRLQIEHPIYQFKNGKLRLYESNDSRPASDVYAWAKAASLALSDVPLGFGSQSDFADGILVKTSIDALAASGDSWTIEVKGKGYGQTPFHFIAEGYNYSDTFINTAGYNYGAPLSYIKVLKFTDNKLAFWWPRTGYWNSFDIVVKSTAGKTDRKNVVTDVINSTEPSVTKKVQINLTRVIFEGDSRLSDARPASDVYAWAKAENKPSYAFSDITGLIAASQLPAIAITDTHVTTTLADYIIIYAPDTTNTQKGDIIVCTTENKTYIHNGGTAGTAADFTLLRTPTDLVTSVNGAVGVVTLTASDVGALPATGGTLSNRLIIDSSVAGDGGWDNAGILLRNNNATLGEVALAMQTAATGSNYWIQGLNQSDVYAWIYSTSFENGGLKLSLDTSGNLIAVGTIQGTQLKSTVAVGTAPMVVTSTTKVTNLNANYLEGLDSSVFVRSDTGDTIAGNHEFYGTNTTGTYSETAIELREVNLVGNVQSADGYAPSISWHWGGRVQNKLFLAADGQMYLDGAIGTKKVLYHAGNLTINTLNTIPLTEDLTLDKDGTTSVGSHGIVFTFHNGTADNWKELNVTSVGTLQFGGTNVSLQGHTHSQYLTDHPTITMGTDTANAASPGYAGTFTVIDSVTKDSNGHVTNVNTKTVTMPSAQSIPSVGNGALSLQKSEGLTGTAIEIGTGTGFTANISTAKTYDIDIGPALPALATLMTGDGSGFIRKNGQDTYSLDTNTYYNSGNNNIGTGATNYASGDHSHGMLRPNIVAANSLDGLTVSNIKSIFYGDTSDSGYQMAFGRWDTIPAAFSGVLSNYGNALMFGRYDTHALIAIDYHSNGGKAVIGGGHNNTISWLKEVQWKITGAASTIANSDLSTWKALISDGYGKVAVSTTTSSDIANLSGTTSNVQTQINAKTKTTLGGSSITEVAYTVSGSTLTITLTP